MNVTIGDLRADYKKALKHISHDDAKQLIQDKMVYYESKMDYYESELDYLEGLYQKIRFEQMKHKSVKVEFEPIIVDVDGKNMDEVMDKVYEKIKHFADTKVLSIKEITTFKI